MSLAAHLIQGSLSGAVQFYPQIIWGLCVFLFHHLLKKT